MIDLIDNKRKKNGKVIYFAIGLALITGVIMIAFNAVSHSQTPTLKPDGGNVNAQADTGASDANLRKGRPPMNLDSWGPSFDTFEQARTDTRLDAIAPTSIPSGMFLDSVRVKSTDGSGMFSTAFYASENNTAKDSDDFFDFMKKGGIAIVYTYDPDTDTFNRQDWMKRFVSEAPGTRTIEQINERPTVISSGDPMNEITTQVIFYTGDTQVDIVSLVHTDADLLDLAKSIN